MALVEFNNDSTPYLNAENLNNNFNELNNNFNEVKTKEYNGNNIDAFKSWLINTASNGSYLVNLNLNGAMTCAIVQKANSNYLSFIQFGYGVGPTYHKYLNGTWTNLPLY